jgi:Ca2+-binding RTX toxin-like protein
LQAKEYLVNKFGQGKTIDNIIVGAGLESYAYLETWSIDKILGTGGNDLIFGEKGSDILEGGYGEDVIYGGEGNDMITGGQGNDYIEGGAGDDIYYINTGEGTDTIEDKEGKNRVIVNGKEIKLLFKQSDGTYKNPDGKITATVIGGELILTDAATGTTLAKLNQNFQDGDFGIHLLDIPDSPQTNIIGDLKPLDFDPITDGIQIKTDECGNVITDPGNPAPNRNDYLYDTSGSDRIEGKGGDDYINAKHGGNDWILGGSGNDILNGGAGDDQVFSESSGEMETFVENGETAVSINEKGDLASGGAGNDLVYGTNRNDTLLGGDGHDLLVGGGGDDVIFGDKNLSLATPGWSTTVESTEMPDGFVLYTVIGNGQDWHEDTFKGDDTIYAGTGNDYVIAGGGDD